MTLPVAPSSIMAPSSLQEALSRRAARVRRFRLGWQKFCENRLSVLGLVIIGLLIFAAAFADVISPYSPVVGVIS